MKLFVLSKENLALSQAEAERLHGEQGTLHDDLLLLGVDGCEKGLALTRSIHEVLFESTKLDKDSETFSWHEHVESPFCVRAKRITDEKTYAGHIWRSLENAGKQASVNLKNPKTTITLFKKKGKEGKKNKILVTKLLWENSDQFFDRRAHLRPRNHPTSLNPKLARAMINLAGPVETILDPFCGSGGILLEGALVGKGMTGTDIDERQIARAEENVAHYDVGALLTVGDATECDKLGNFGAIVTDLPLGKNAKLDDPEKTFTAFFTAAAKITKTMVVAIDAKFDLGKCFGEFWEEKDAFDWYLHKGMQKRIFILSAS